jgi:hypothetical protein
VRVSSSTGNPFRGSTGPSYGALVDAGSVVVVVDPLVVVASVVGVAPVVSGDAVVVGSGSAPPEPLQAAAIRANARKNAVSRCIAATR